LNGFFYSFPVKIAIIGFGKMGRAVADVAQAANHEISAIIDPQNPDATAAEISAENLNGAEVAIDFTHPDVVIDNIRRLAALNISIIVGTTGWYEQLSEVEKIVTESKIGFLYAGNFSIGVNIFYAIVESASKLLSGKGFDVAIHETHHNQKADAPSGTAREIAQKILTNFKEKKEVMSDNEILPIPPERLQISASRVGKVVGVHTVNFDGSSDLIQLTHSGKNRDGYAAGSVAAAEFLVGKVGMFTAKDWLGF